MNKGSRRKFGHGDGRSSPFCKSGPLPKNPNEPLNFNLWRIAQAAQIAGF